MSTTSDTVKKVLAEMLDIELEKMPDDLTLGQYVLCKKNMTFSDIQKALEIEFEIGFSEKLGRDTTIQKIVKQISSLKQN